MKKTLSILLFTAWLILFLTSCSIFSPIKTQSYNNYLLNEIPSVSKNKRHPITLFVSPVDADSLYNTNAMAYTAHPYQLDYFAKNKWADTPAKMLQPLIVQTLNNTHYFHAVTTSANVTTSDYILNTKILELRQLFFLHSSRLIFRLNAEIINAKTGDVIANKQFLIDNNVNQYGPYGGVIAANNAVAIVLKQLSSFCVKVI